MLAENFAETLVEATDVDLATEITRDLVRIPSVCGDEYEIALYLRDKMQELGFPEVYLQEIAPRRFNAIGRVDGAGPGSTFVFNGHTDTKPVVLGWTRDPFGGEIVESRVYGHGIGDMKAACAAHVAAAYALLKQKDQWRGTVYVANVCDHMGEQKGSIAFHNATAADFCLLGEPSDMAIYLGHRGRYYWDITALGRAAHTCHRDRAINAIAKMAGLVLELEKIHYFPEISTETKDLYGAELFTAVGRIFGGLPPDGPSMIPDRCTIRIDSRPQPGVRPDEVRAVIEAGITRAQEADPELAVEMVLADEKRPHSIALEHLLVQTLESAYTRVTGGAPPISAASWLGDTASFGHMLPTVIFGPGREPIYMANEYVTLDEIAVTTRVDALTAGALLSAN